MGTENKIYNASDFSRYHSGGMPVAEMHALEKAALLDPFLSDALEGYERSENAVNESADIHQRLEEKIAGNKNRNQKGIWLKIAALFIVMAGIGYLIYQGNSKKEDSPFAQNENPVIKSTTPDSIPPPAEIVAAPSVTRDESTGLKSPEPNKRSEVASKKPENVSEAAPTLSTNSESDDLVNADKSIGNSQPKKENEFLLKGKVTNEAGKGLIGATVTVPAHNINTITDSNGRFYLQSDHKDAAANISSSGYINKTKVLNAGNEETVVLQRKADAQYKNKEAANNAAKKKNIDKNASAPVVNSPAVPEGGMDKYTVYLKQNIAPVYDENGIQYNGKVGLQFFLAQDGQPQNITIKKSLCSSCDLQAIQLLKNGVKWTGEKNKKYDLEIEF